MPSGPPPDGAEQREPLETEPSWMGHSVGHWEDDTLVVETIGFNARGWTDVYPRTRMLRTVERSA